MPAPRSGPPGSSGRPSCCARCAEDRILYPTTHEYAIIHLYEGPGWEGIRWFCRRCRKNLPLPEPTPSGGSRSAPALTMDEQERILFGGGYLRNREPHSLFDPEPP